MPADESAGRISSLWHLSLEMSPAPSRRRCRVAADARQSVRRHVATFHYRRTQSDAAAAVAVIGATAAIDIVISGAAQWRAGNASCAGAAAGGDGGADSGPD